jgi:hypothetical protein
VSLEVFPEAGSGPLSVAAGASSALIEVAEQSAVDPVTGRDSMFVRVVQIRDGDDADGAGAAVPPVIRLGVAPGPVVAVGSAATPVAAQPGGDVVAVATLTAEGGDIYLVEVEVLESQPQWVIQIGNADSRARRYIGVIASSRAAAARPWLDVWAGTLAFRAQVNETTAAQEVVIANYGPGPLTLSDADGADLGAGFRLVSVSPRPIGANRRAVAQIGFTAPGAPGAPAIAHDFPSDDPAAGRIFGHNNHVTLTATVFRPSLWSAGDVLGIQGFNLCRLDKAAGTWAAVVAVTPQADVFVAVDPASGDAVLLDAGFLKRVDRFTGQVTALGVGRIVAPIGMAVDRNGIIVFLYRDDKTRIGRVTLAGAWTGAAEVSGLTDPRGIALEANGDVVVACGGFGMDARVMRSAASNGQLSTVAASGSPSGPVGGPVAVERDGTILAMRRFQGAGGGFTFSEGVLIRVNPRNGDQTSFTGASALSEPTALVVAPDGTIVVAASGGVVTVNPGTAARTVLTSQTVRRLTVVPVLPN